MMARLVPQFASRKQGHRHLRRLHGESSAAQKPENSVASCSRELKEHACGNKERPSLPSTSSPSLLPYSWGKPRLRCSLRYSYACPTPPSPNPPSSALRTHGRDFLQRCSLPAWQSVPVSRRRPASLKAVRCVAKVWSRARKTPPPLLHQNCKFLIQLLLIYP